MPLFWSIVILKMPVAIPVSPLLLNHSLQGHSLSHKQMKREVLWSQCTCGAARPLLSFYSNVLSDLLGGTTVCSVELAVVTVWWNFAAVFNSPLHATHVLLLPTISPEMTPLHRRLRCWLMTLFLNSGTRTPMIATIEQGTLRMYQPFMSG